MKQSRLDRFFVTTRQRPHPRLTFFDLPFNIRCKIYELVGLVRTCPIELNLERIQDCDSSGSSDDDGEPDSGYHCYIRNHTDFCICEPLPWGLICVSREVSRIFYSRNRFKICRSWPGGLLALHNLTALSLSSLTTVYIRINFCLKCPEKYRSCESIDEINDRPLKQIISRNDKWILADWTSLCKRMAQHIRPGHLKLCFICDTENVETAKAFLSPLKMFPTLAHCSIRLSQEPSPELQHLVEETIAHLSAPPPSTPFPFNALPIELQSQILAQTDLVAPYALEWTSEEGYFCRKNTQVLKNCDICSEVRESCCEPLDRGSFDSRCSCWKYPYGLFGTSRNIRQEALRIFYSENHIIVAGTPYYWPVAPDLLSFLSTIPQHARKRLRSLQLDFPDRRCLHHPVNEIFGEFTAAVNTLCVDADLSKLTLTIVVGGFYPDSNEVGHTDGPNRSLAEARWISYQRMVEPLYLLGGQLKDCFVHLPWVYLHGDARERDEGVLERRIMGDEMYDGVCRGKFERLCTWDVEPDWR